MNFKRDRDCFQWPFIEKIANNDLTRIVGLIPLVGYIILFNDEISEMISFDNIAGVDPDATSPFYLSGLCKMRLVFFGCILLFIANVLYKLCRPSSLEIAKDDIIFSTRVMESFTVEDLKNIETDVYSDHWRPRLDFFWIVFDQIRSKKPLISGYRPDVRVYMMQKHGDYIRLLAREWWVGKMHTYKPVRITTLIIAIGGYLMLVIPTLDISQAVLRDIASSLLSVLY